MEALITSSLPNKAFESDAVPASRGYDTLGRIRSLGAPQRGRWASKLRTSLERLSLSR